MKFNISEKDMEIILDALEALRGEISRLQRVYGDSGHQDMKHSDDRRGYTIDEVDLLFQSFDNAGNYHAVMKDKL